VTAFYDGCGHCSVCDGETADRYLVKERKAGKAAKPAKSERLSKRAGALPTSRVRSLREEDDFPVHDDDDELFERLRSLRKELADLQGVPPYVIFSDATLRGMVRRRPKTAEELLEVSGVGQVKLERYGKAFLDELDA
jgi:ATP-dependent DNA helicase RecQ